MIRKNILLAGVAAFGLLAQPLCAQEASTPVRGKEAGDFVIGASIIGVVPMNGGSVDVIGGTPDVSNSVTAQLDFTYFFTPNLAVNLIAATTRHDAEVSGSALGVVDLGHVWALPPTLTFQYHFLPRERFSPYVGAGVNYTVFFNEKAKGGFTDFDLKDSFGFALQAGFDYMIDRHWGFNFDVKKLFLEPKVKVNNGLVAGKVKIDPWLIAAGVTYRF